MMIFATGVGCHLMILELYAWIAEQIRATCMPMKKYKIDWKGVRNETDG